MVMRKTAVAIPEELLAQVDAAAEARGESRSAISALAERHALSTDEAAHLELAARQGATLIPLDKELGAAAAAAGGMVHAPGRTSAAQMRERYNT
jgi:metal-responsive CopG/Arc/MetJ family transcriptional regulator